MPLQKNVNGEKCISRVLPTYECFETNKRLSKRWGVGYLHFKCIIGNSVPNGVNEEQLINVDSKKLGEDGNLVVCGSLRGAYQILSVILANTLLVMNSVWKVRQAKQKRHLLVCYYSECPFGFLVINLVIVLYKRCQH